MSVSHTTEEGIRDLLVAAGVGVFGAATGWAILIGKIIEAPDTMIVINQTGGKPPNPKWNIDFPSVMVRIRGGAGNDAYTSARQKARDIKDALLGLPSQDLNGDRWTAINMISDIAFLGYDQKSRPSFSLNFGLIIEPSNAGYRES